MAAPFETAAEIRAAAKIQVAEIVAKVEAMRQNGGMKDVNRRYKSYRPGGIVPRDRTRTGEAGKGRAAR
jgi:hypothetical protein